VKRVKSRPDEYHKAVDANDRFFETIEFLAKIDHTSRKRVTNDLPEPDISDCVGRKSVRTITKRLRMRTQ
jgi:hypothetical protein